MSFILDNISPVLELFLNGIELIALIVSIVTVIFFMLNKYSKALKLILNPCGLTFWQRVRILFLCRKSHIKKRAFLEYAILETGGTPVLRADWHVIINSFKAFYHDGEIDELVYEIPNCTPLIEGEFSEASKRYFDYFSKPKVRKAFGISEGSFPWVLKIRIAEAYATPTCLLTGLLSQYDESWEEFIKRYVSTAYMTDNGELEGRGILSTELYLTFAWLLWGPSYELEYRSYWAGLCQLSFGDESNSIPAIADAESDVASRLKNKFLENEGRRYGGLISADVSLCEKKSFYTAMRGSINPENAYFYDKIENNDLAFAVKLESFSPCLNYKAKKYYSTAYVWILFELENEDSEFEPEKSLAFFEHANLADRTTYLFLIETLIEKSLKHFEDIFSKEVYSERKYRFVCAMNDKIAQSCIKRYEEIMESDTELGKKLKERVILETKRTPSEVFSAYDEFFMPGKTLEYVEVSFKDRSTVTDFGQFYTEVYMDSFPDDDERETFDNFLKYLRKSEEQTDYGYHIVLAKDENSRVVGGCVFNYYPSANAGVIEFIAVRSDMQSGGIGTLLYKHVVSLLKRDARRFKKKSLDYIFCEIDSPYYSKSDVKKYLYFWTKNKYMHLSFSYVQPALSPGQKAVSGLWFIVTALSEAKSNVPSSVVIDVLYNYLKYAMDIENPNECKEYRDMVAELEKSEYVKLESILKQ
ncbi:MAG: GNAT family N-acetyltransferase [Clostridia bacterium]|nr:GNAT family N-acetyltransferase [Clostridia bacterium]